MPAALEEFNKIGGEKKSSIQMQPLKRDTGSSCIFCGVFLAVPQQTFTAWHRQVQLPLSLAGAVLAELGPLPVEN